LASSSVQLTAEAHTTTVEIRNRVELGRDRTAHPK
jgi:hypothetical protein